MIWSLVDWCEIANCLYDISLIIEKKMRDYAEQYILVTKSDRINCFSVIYMWKQSTHFVYSLALISWNKIWLPYTKHRFDLNDDKCFFTLNLRLIFDFLVMNDRQSCFCLSYVFLQEREMLFEEQFFNFQSMLYCSCVSCLLREKNIAQTAVDIKFSGRNVPCT